MPVDEDLCSLHPGLTARLLDPHIGLYFVLRRVMFLPAGITRAPNSDICHGNVMVFKYFTSMTLNLFPYI